MRKLLLLSILLFSLVQSGVGQSMRVYTHPQLPPHAALERLSLTLGWSARVPMRGLRDAIASFQVLPTKTGHEVLVQTRSGLVQLMDAETGDLLWRTPVGLPYRLQQAGAGNSKNIFIVREDRLYVLDRKTGRHRLWKIDPDSHNIRLGFPLFQSPTAGPAADEAAVFFPSDHRIFAYLLPEYTADQLTLPSSDPEGALPPGVKPESSSQPEFLWNVRLQDSKISQPPLLSGEQISVLGEDGTLVSINKFKSDVRFHYKAYGTIAAPVGQYENLAYVGAEDKTVYALDMKNKALLWRYFAGGPIERAIQTTDHDIFITARRIGLARLHRDTGEKVWLNKEADLFLAVNQRLLYALDQRRNLLIIDLVRGRTLAQYDISGFSKPYSNTITDRIYLANDDGLIVCMHHKANVSPFLPVTPPRETPKEKKQGEPEKKEPEKLDEAAPGA